MAGGQSVTWGAGGSASTAGKSASSFPPTTRVGKSVVHDTQSHTYIRTDRIAVRITTAYNTYLHNFLFAYIVY